MTGIRLSLQINDAAARDQMQDLLDRMENRQGFFKSVGELMVRSTSDSFRNQRAPDGTPWVSLRPATIRARERKGQLPLTILRSNSKGKSGSALAGSVSSIATNDEVAIGSPVRHAAIHQLGGTINKPARAAKIYRRKNADGQVGRLFVRKEEADVVTDVTIPAHTIRIPARPFLGVSAADERAILEMGIEWLSL
ncbi:phage virion morphogenesis protein [Paracoccus sp. 11-3]|uniref:Phage virion morphogenesis protein n=2 Tax=Paracoccus amoyensis TaxID=2760093 RepID=A0A926G6I9_9RHOB|nr:phage virion morphogenesis protein [Paracoccus amoyensis]